jgi:hypothetical protein
MLSKHDAGKLFTKIIGINKIILVLFLVGFAYFNHVTDHICENPKEFMADSIGLGLSAAIPVAFMALKRGQPTSSIISLSLLSFLFLFFYNFVTEMSGENSSEPNKLEHIQSSKPFKIAAGVILGILGLILAYLAFIVRDTVPGTLLEAILFSIPTTITMTFIAKHHNQDNLKSVFIKNFLILFTGYFVLQWGGFNKHLFVKPKCL